MSTAANILVCDTDMCYTILNRYNPKSHRFEGEYSLLHNDYTHDDYFLSKFLVMHRGHSICLLDSEDARYYEIKQRYRHFAEEDIESYVSELLEQKREEAQVLSAQQNAGELQLLIAKKMIEQEWEKVQNTASHSERDTYVLLGQDFAFGKSVQTIRQIAEFGLK